MVSVEQCVICPVGTFCPVGTDEPTSCAPGTFNAQTNATTCVKCAAGSFQSEERQTGCEACPGGHYCEEGASAPLPCPGATKLRITARALAVLVGSL